ncbi:MAG: hypothetical protein OEM26_00225 [Saprospiraceae bacterium]|nr:hypothetical protein [Saprospiraceae bacterium]
MSFWRKVQHFFRSRRAEAMHGLAPSLRMKYRRRDQFGLLNLLKDFHLFRRGHSRKIKHILWRDEVATDLKVRVFDYQYTVGGGQNSRTISQTVFFIYSKDLGLPQFFLQPEKFFHRLGAWLGKEDIDFVEYPKFSDTYHLKGEDEELIRHTFSDDVLHYFTKEANWHVEGLNYFLIVYRAGKKLKVPVIKQFYQKGLEIFEILKNEGFKI